MKMIKYVTTVLAVLFFVALSVPPTGMAREANTIDELVVMFDDSKCGDCHAEIYEQWQNSWHAKAVVSSLKGMRNFIKIGLAKEWNKLVDRSQLLKCLDCHAPAVNFASEKLAKKIGGMIVTAFEKKGTKAGDKAKAQLARLNIGCLSCHNIKATSVARGLRGDPIKDAVYGPHGYDSDGHTSIESVELTRSVFCMQCHGKYNASDGETIQCNTLSGSYQNTYYNLGGSKTCQECHMKKGHLFPGGHDLDTVKQGLSLDVQVTAYQHLPGKVPGVKNSKAWVPSAVVTALVGNRSGHRIPDG
jgi:hypothetical protein